VIQITSYAKHILTKVKKIIYPDLDLSINLIAELKKLIYGVCSNTYQDLKILISVIRKLELYVKHSYQYMRI